MTTQIIEQAKAKIEQGVDPKQKDAYDRIVLAGMKVMFTKGTHEQLMQGLVDAPDKLKTAVDGVIGLVGVLFKESRNTMPVVPMIMAGITLLYEGLEFMEKAGMVQVDGDSLAKTTQYYLETLLPKLGMTPDKMQALLAQTKGVMQDPAKVAEFKQNAGA